MNQAALKAIVERCEAVQHTVAYDENDYVLSEFDRLMPIILELLSIAEERGKALEFYASEDTWIKKEFKVNGEFSQWWDRLPNDKSIVPYKIGDATGNFNVLGAKARIALDSTTKRLEQLAGLGEGK